MVVPVRDDAPRLARCLDALAVACRGVACEVVVVDDASRDGSGDVARSHPLRPLVVAGTGAGSYAARVAGAAVARGTWLAFTDADCEPDPGWVAAGLRAGADARVLAGVVRPATPSGRPGAWERYDRATYLRQEDHVSEGFGATAALWVHRAVWDEVGGFDPTLRSSGDLEWGLRATARGHAPVLVPDLVVTHASRTSARQTWRLHRRLGAGWKALHPRGLRPPAWRDPSLRLSLGGAVTAVAQDGTPHGWPALRRRRLLPVHVTVLAARWTGRLLG